LERVVKLEISKGGSWSSSKSTRKGSIQSGKSRSNGIGASTDYQITLPANSNGLATEMTEFTEHLLTKNAEKLKENNFSLSDFSISTIKTAMNPNVKFILSGKHRDNRSSDEIIDIVEQIAVELEDKFFPSSLLRN
jgi:hypothetical protein